MTNGWVCVLNEGKWTHWAAQSPQRCRSCPEFRCQCRQKRAGFGNTPAEYHVRNSFGRGRACSLVLSFTQAALYPLPSTYMSLQFPREAFAAPRAPTTLVNLSAQPLLNKPLGPVTPKAKTALACTHTAWTALGNAKKLPSSQQLFLHRTRGWKCL